MNEKYLSEYVKELDKEQKKNLINTLIEYERLDNVEDIEDEEIAHNLIYFIDSQFTYILKDSGLYGLNVSELFKK